MKSTRALSDPLSNVSPEALEELPIFPLPETVLLPRTIMSLYVFEPRYRALMEDCIAGHRMMAIGMLDARHAPDEYQRPSIHKVAGLGRLRRSLRRPDGCFTIVLEGIGRADISAECAPTKSYRRARARVLVDEPPHDDSDLDFAVFNLRTLSTRALPQLTAHEAEIIQSLDGVTDPAFLADVIAAAILEDSEDRQRVLATPSVVERVNLVAGLLGAMLVAKEQEAGQLGATTNGLESGHAPSGRRARRSALGWGIKPGRA